MILFGIALFSVVQSILCLQDEITVELPEGTIRGHVMQNQNGVNYYAFHEVPYAAPPVDSNRFQAPKDVEPWEGILNTTENTKMCYQFEIGLNTSSMDPGINQTEDCLYLNIYSPAERGSEDLLPVFFWIHGGAFSAGTGAYVVFPPNDFIDYNIVVVTINYRLGPFGFLSTMDGVVPGNLGLKDQRKALEWLKPRISLFGGDPEKITIGGESAGAMSVSFLLLGQGTEGLFRGAIQQSGSALCRETFTQSAKSYAYQLGSNLNADFTSSNSSLELLNLLQNSSTEEIIAATENVQFNRDYSVGNTVDLLWAAVIENENETDPLITKPMLDSLLNGNFYKVPTLLGYNSEESLSFYVAVDESLQTTIKSTLDGASVSLIGPEMNVEATNLLALSQGLKKIYTNDSFSTDEAAFLKLSTDAGFTNGIIKQAQVASAHVPVYLYQFSFVGNASVLLYPNGVRPDVPGAGKVGHGEEQFYMWWASQLNLEVRDAILSIRLLTLITNFVKFLNPTPEADDLLDKILWTPVNGTEIKYLNINDTLSIEANPRNFQQIDELFQQYLISPYVVY